MRRLRSRLLIEQTDKGDIELRLDSVEEPPQGEFNGMHYYLREHDYENDRFRDSTVVFDSAKQALCELEKHRSPPDDKPGDDWWEAWQRLMVAAMTASIVNLSSHIGFLNDLWDYVPGLIG